MNHRVRFAPRMTKNNSISLGADLEFISQPLSAWPEWSARPGKKTPRIESFLPSLFAFFGWEYQEFSPCPLGTVFPLSTDQWRSQGIELSTKHRLCLVLIDGMGQQQLSKRKGHIPFMRSRLTQATHLFGAQPQTCVPSTTVAALTALHTGLTPAITGMLGYECWNPVQQSNLNLINFESPQPVSPREWSDQPTFFSYARQAGLKQKAVVPEKFIGSSLSEITLRDADCRGEKGLTDRIRATVQEFRQGADYVYLYWSDLDHTGHHKGWSSPEWTAELELIDSGLQELRMALPDDVLLVVTADHGMVDVSQAQTIDLAVLPIAEQIQQISGEPRALHIHLKPQYCQQVDSAISNSAVGTATEASAIRLAHQSTSWPHNRQVKPEVIEQWQSLLGGHFLVTERYWDFYGPVVQFNRLGDLTVFAGENFQLIDSRYHSPGVQSLVGVHGSLSSSEMEIPFLLA